MSQFGCLWLVVRLLFCLTGDGLAGVGKLLRVAPAARHMALTLYKLPEIHVF